MSHATELIDRAQSGDQQAVDELVPIVYGELRRLAAIRLAAEGAGHTLQPTALVHEAYLRLLSGNNGESPLFANRNHFFAAAAEAMRRILIDRARAKNATKRGGESTRVSVDLNLLSALDETHSSELLALDEALVDLANNDRVSAELIKLRFYAGLTHMQAAESLGLSRREADRVWLLAKAWLFRRIQEN